MVHRIWQAHRLQPHRIESFKLTTDPAAEEKVRDIDEFVCRGIWGTGADFLAFLQKLARRYRSELHVILDNASGHKTPDVQAWLTAHPQVHFHFIPTGASWLNMIEAWFSVLTRQSIRRGRSTPWASWCGISGATLDHWIAHPVPFIWTKSAEQIIARAIRH